MGRGYGAAAWLWLTKHSWVAFATSSLGVGIRECEIGVGLISFVFVAPSRNFTAFQLFPLGRAQSYAWP